jgi:hypothetical protein
MEPNPLDASISPNPELLAYVDRRSRDRDDVAPRRRRERRVTPRGRRASDSIKLECPFCHESASAVLSSRGGVVESKVQRRRECVGCGERYPTKETLDQEGLERELAQKYGPSVLEQLLATPASPSTWETAERLLHRLWGQAKDHQYIKRDWNDFQQVLAGLRRCS